MSAHTRMHRTSKQDHFKIIIVTPQAEKISYISSKNMSKLEDFLEKYGDSETEDHDDKPVAWEVLAKDRIAKHKKAGLVLRGMRYRENISQKELAKRSQVSQNEISKIENGKRVVGEKVAKRLAASLNINYRLLIES